VSAPAARGTTTISDRAFMKIAEEVAGEDDRVADRPHATGSVSGAVASVHYDVAVRYPAPVPKVAAEIRHHVRERMRQLTGIAVENVDIDVVRLVPAPRSGHQKPS